MCGGGENRTRCPSLDSRVQYSYLLGPIARDDKFHTLHSTWHYREYFPLGECKKIVLQLHNNFDLVMNRGGVLSLPGLTLPWCPLQDMHNILQDLSVQDVPFRASPGDAQTTNSRGNEHHRDLSNQSDEDYNRNLGTVDLQPHSGSGQTSRAA